MHYPNSRASVSNYSTRITVLEKENNDLKETIVKIQNQNPMEMTSDQQLIRMEKTIREMEERSRRKCNIVVFGITESITDGKSDTDLEETKIRNLIQVLLRSHETFTLNPKRLGKFDPHKTTSRPLKISLSNEKAVFEIIKKATTLKNNPDFAGVTISTDKTPMQQALYRSVKEELTRRSSNGEEGLQIKYKHGIPTIVHNNAHPENQEN